MHFSVQNFVTISYVALSTALSLQCNQKTQVLFLRYYLKISFLDLQGLKNDIENYSGFNQTYFKYKGYLFKPSFTNM